MGPGPGDPSLGKASQRAVTSELGLGHGAQAVGMGGELQTLSDGTWGGGCVSVSPRTIQDNTEDTTLTFIEYLLCARPGATLGTHELTNRPSNPAVTTSLQR